MQCPSCSHPLVPRLLGCDHCGVEVRGTFALNEFATLSGEDLNLLRIFVLAEGRIRDMEAPLGLSYPTIRTRLAALREKLAPGSGPPRQPSAPSAVTDTLEKLQAGEVSFDDALASIRKLRTKKGRTMKDQGFKEALQKVLTMAKEGAINDDQAAALIEEIAKMDAAESAVPAKTDGSEKRSIFERMVDAVSGGRTSVVSGVLASGLKENNFSMSQVDVTQGKDAVFQNNTIRMSRLSNIEPIGSEISSNTMGSASIGHINAKRSQLTGSSIFASSIEHVALEDSSVTALGMRSSVWSHMKLDRTRIEDLGMHAAVLKQLTLGPDLVWEHSKIESSQVKDITAAKSVLNDVAIDIARIAGLTIRGSSLKLSMVRGYKWKDVRFLDSIFEDVLFGAGDSNRKCVFADVTFESCNFKKAIFADTVFADVTIRNVTLENVKAIGITLKDKVIDGNAAFLEAIGAAPENHKEP